MKLSRAIVLAAGLAGVSLLGLAASADELKLETLANDYPTVDRADYVFACMQTNGPTRDVLEKCSCSIDQIAALLPYAEYIEAETIMSVGMRGGDAASLFSSPQMQKKIHTLKLAQVEAELRCF
jgi:lysyl-tRNA synthetase class II